MLAIKTFLSKPGLCAGLLPAISKPISRNLTTLKLIKSNENVVKNLFSKSQIKYKWLTRKETTTAAAVAQNPIIIARKSVGYWLLICSGMVYVAVFVGGYTRITESGLSMVNWRFSYEKFPSSEQEWVEEFERYKQYPEYKLLKKDLTLEEFQKIFATEYFHRYWGRCVGLTFALPAVLFWLKGVFTLRLKKRIVAFGVLILAQGLLGWYMVKSGLEDRFHKETDVPRVSQYRLAAHLGLALTLYTGFMLTAMELLIPPQKLTSAIQGVGKLRMLAHSCKGLVFLTALSGAFVAGLDAGLVYNSFPKMGDKWIPDDILAITPTLKNFTENPTTVQFDHRILGLTTFSVIMATWFLCKRHRLPGRANMAANYLALAAIVQVLFGITTLVHHVPHHLALSHQSGSVFLLTMAIWLSHELKLLKHIPK